MNNKKHLAFVLSDLAKASELIDTDTAIVLHALAGGLLSYGNAAISNAVMPIIHESKLRLSRDIREWQNEE
jgi:hypothetical protein